MGNARRRRRAVRSKEHKLREAVANAFRAAHRAALPEMVRLRYPSTSLPWVNQGFCDGAAEAARLILKRQGIRSIVLKDDEDLCWSDHEIYRDTPWTHAWLWVEGKHHDAEALYGVRDWLQLPHFKRWLSSDWGGFDPATVDEVGQVEIHRVHRRGRETQLLYQEARLIASFEASLDRHLGVKSA